MARAAASGPGPAPSAVADPGPRCPRHRALDGRRLCGPPRHRRRRCAGLGASRSPGPFPDRMAAWPARPVTWTRPAAPCRRPRERARRPPADLRALPTAGSPMILVAAPARCRPRAASCLLPVARPAVARDRYRLGSPGQRRAGRSQEVRRRRGAACGGSCMSGRPGVTGRAAGSGQAEVTGVAAAPGAVAAAGVTGAPGADGGAVAAAGVTGVPGADGGAAEVVGASGTGSGAAEAADPGSRPAHRSSPVPTPCAAAIRSSPVAAGASGPGRPVAAVTCRRGDPPRSGQRTGRPISPVKSWRGGHNIACPAACRASRAR